MSDHIEKHFFTSNGVSLSLTPGPQRPARTYPKGPAPDQLENKIAELKRALRAMDAREPEDMDSEEHENWALARETLEDMMDDLMDLMDDPQE